MLFSAPASPNTNNYIPVWVSRCLHDPHHLRRLPPHISNCRPPVPCRAIRSRPIPPCLSVRLSVCECVRRDKNATRCDRRTRSLNKQSGVSECSVVCVLCSVRALGGEASRSCSPFSVGGLGMKAGVAASCHGIAEESRPL